MKYTHPDIVNRINARKEGEDTLSWIENFCIYLSESSCKPRKEGKIENVLVLSIENEERLSIYDCFFKIQQNGTRFCVNKAIPDVCFSNLKALLEEVKWRSKETQEYWNDVLVKKEKTGYNLAKVDESVLQREQTKASCCCPDLSMIDFLSNLGNEIESILQCLEINKSYHKVYIANGANFMSYYPLVAPLQYALYKRFKTDSVEPFVKPELFNNQPLTSYGWKTNKARFYTGTLSRAIGLNTSVEVSLNDLMNAGGVVVTFPLDENNGCYTMPATPVLRECTSDNTNHRRISLSGEQRTWADLYGQVQWDYKVGELAFKQVKLSIYADGCQRLYLMDGDKVLTVISTNGNKVEEDEIENNLYNDNPNSEEEKIRYVLDTNVFIDEPNIIDIIKSKHEDTQYKIVLTDYVISELDRKKLVDDLKPKVQKAQRNILKATEENSDIFLHETSDLSLLGDLDRRNNDYRILSVALKIKNQGYRTVLITNDNGLRIVAHTRSVESYNLDGYKTSYEL